MAMQTDPPPPSSHRKSARFGEFEVLGVLGRGGMATVAVARALSRRELPDFVALKFLHSSMCDDPDVIDSFEQEAILGMSLRHESLCRTFSLEVLNDRRAIVMELLEGHSLARLFRTLQVVGTSPQSHWAAAYTVAKLARALEVLHEARAPDGTFLRAVHRDVTPQNVLLTHTGEVKLVDFGVAFSETRKLKTKKGLVKGKLAYLSPEYLLGRPWDHRVDVWSLGVLFWEFLAGRRLFPLGSASAVMREVMLSVIRPPGAWAPWVPPELDAIAMGALSRNPDMRTPSAGALAASLERYLGLGSTETAPAQLASWLDSLPQLEDNSGINQLQKGRAPMESIDDPVDLHSATTHGIRLRSGG